MKAIPTLYNGIQFRSRLEATWAAFFDAARWEWEYEPAIFDGAGWTPDFWIPNLRTLAEVKPVAFPSDWKHHEALKYIGKRVDGEYRQVLLLGLAPYESLANLTDHEGAFIRRFSNIVLGPYYMGNLREIAGETFVHQCPDEEGEEPSSLMTQNWPVGQSEFGLFDDGQCQEHGAHIARALWAQAKNAVQWRPPT